MGHAVFGAVKPKLNPSKKVSDVEFAQLEEFLADCLTSSRLSAWEQQFTSGVRSRFELYKTKLVMSEKQWDQVHRIEQKIYAAG